LNQKKNKSKQLLVLWKAVGFPIVWSGESTGEGRANLQFRMINPLMNLF
jgi:hypothetical protein